MIKESTNAEGLLMFEDLETFQQKIDQYTQYCKELNKIGQELRGEGVVMKKETLSDINKRGVDGLLDALKNAFEVRKSGLPDSLKSSLTFNPAKFFHKCHVWNNYIAWLRSHLRIDTELLDVKGGEVYLPEKARNKMREMYTVHITSERQKSVINLVKQINEASQQLANEVKAAGFDPGNFLWDGNYCLLYPDYETGEIKCNYLVLTGIS